MSSRPSLENVGNPFAAFTTLEGSPCERAQKKCSLKKSSESQFNQNRFEKIQKKIKATTVSFEGGIIERAQQSVTHLECENARVNLRRISASITTVQHSFIFQNNSRSYLGHTWRVITIGQ